LTNRSFKANQHFLKDHQERTPQDSKMVSIRIDTLDDGYPDYEISTLFCNHSGREQTTQKQNATCPKKYVSLINTLAHIPCNPQLFTSKSPLPGHHLFSCYHQRTPCHLVL